MESYQVWDVTTPSIPPRSRLYRLEPIGVGTSSVECLASYIARLAEAHCVTLKALMMHEIFPSQGLDFTEPHHYRHLSTFCEQNSSYLNDRDDFERQCWIAERVGELLAAARDLRVVTTKEQIATMLSLCVDQYAQGNVSVLARKMNVSPSCLWNYLHKDGLPFFDFLIRLCYTLSIPPLEFLTASSLPRRRYLSNPAKDLPEVSRCTGNRITQDDVRRMRHVLETLLAREGIARYPSLKEIAQWIGCRVETLRRHCPDLCRASVKRYKRQWAEASARVQMREASARVQMREALESAVAGS